MLLIMFPLEHWCDLPIYINLPLGQFFGAIIFWKIDKWILRNEILRQGELWQIQRNTKCVVCGKTGKSYRLTNKENMYDKSDAQTLEYRTCAREKYFKINEREI